MPERPPNIIITGTGLVALAGVTSVIWISTVISGCVELSTAPISSLPTTGRPPTSNCSVRLTRHVTLGTFLRNAADHLAIELLDDLGTALLPPRLGAGDLLAVLERQDFGQVGIRVGERLVVVGVVRRRLVSARARAKRLDAELLHHVLMVGGRRRGVGIGRRARGRLRRRRLPGAGAGLRPVAALAAAPRLAQPLRRGRLLGRPTRAVAIDSAAIATAVNPIRYEPATAMSTSFQLVLVRALAPCCRGE